MIGTKMFQKNKREHTKSKKEPTELKITATKEQEWKLLAHLYTDGVSLTFDPSGSSITGRPGEVCVLSHPSSLGFCVFVIAALMC